MEPFDYELKNFSKISLSELNAKASFLKRIDEKYLLTESEFKNILDKLRNDFYVLEIWQKTVFKYNSVYMDTADYLFYKQHQNNEKIRTKIRTRNYVDTGTAFFEYKQKEDWVTKKFRYELKDISEHWIMTPESQKFFEKIYKSIYKKSPEKIFPSLVTEYYRITLCAKYSEERMTVDLKVKTKDLRIPESKVISYDNLVIVESKSMTKNSICSQIMKSSNICSSGSCSKYCLWLAYNWSVGDNSTFTSTINEIEKIKNKSKVFLPNYDLVVA